MIKKFLMIAIILIVAYYFLFDGKEVVDELINRAADQIKIFIDDNKAKGVSSNNIMLDKGNEVIYLTI